MSNNTFLSRKGYVRKLRRMGIRAEEDEIFSSAFVTAHYLSERKPHARIYMIGEAGLRKEIENCGLQIVPDDTEKVDFVVVGMDRRFNFKKMSMALNLILSGGELIGSNPDVTYPTESGVLPGCGAILAGIEACSGRKAQVIGKPSPIILDFVFQYTGFNREETVIVGDRLDTDIKLAEDFGLFSILVLTGVSKKEDLAHFSARPDMVVENLGVLKELLSQNREVK